MKTWNIKQSCGRFFIIFFHQLNKTNNIKIGKIAIISLESWGGAIPYYMQLCLEIFGDRPVATRQGPQKEQSFYYMIYLLFNFKDICDGDLVK